MGGEPDWPFLRISASSESGTHSRTEFEINVVPTSGQPTIRKFAGLINTSPFIGTDQGAPPLFITYLCAYSVHFFINGHYRFSTERAMQLLRSELQPLSRARRRPSDRRLRPEYCGC